MPIASDFKVYLISSGVTMKESFKFVCGIFHCLRQTCLYVPCGHLLGKG